MSGTFLSFAVSSRLSESWRAVGSSASQATSRCSIARFGVGDVTVADLPVEPGLTRLETQEKHLIITALRRHHGHRVRTAVDVGMGVRTLHNRCRYYGIDPDDFAASMPEVVTA